MSILGAPNLAGAEKKGESVRLAPERLKLGSLSAGSAVTISLAVSSILLLAGILTMLFWVSASEGIRAGASIILGFGVAGVAISALIAQYEFVIGDWNHNSVGALLEAYFNRDRRGRRMPGTKLVNSLNKLENLEEVLANQSYESLLALLASKKSNEASILRSLGEPGVLEALLERPDCPILIKIDFAKSDNVHVRRAASRLLPPLLWFGATSALLESKHAEARAAAIQRPTTPRSIKLAACLRDESQIVRQVALDALKELTPRDYSRLLRSHHVDIRLYAAKSGRLSRKQQVEVCANDENNAIRSEAWRQIGQITEDETSILLQSVYLDARSGAVLSGKLSRKKLIDVCRSDKAQGVRLDAWQQIGAPSAAEVSQLLRSGHADTRARAVQSGLLSQRTLEKLCRRDKAHRVINEAWQRLQINSSERTSRRKGLKLTVERRLAASRAKLHNLLNKSEKVIEKKLPRTLEDMSVEELRPLLQLRQRIVRVIVIKHIGERRDTSATEMLLPLISSAEHQKDVVEAILNIEGNKALPRVVLEIGLRATFEAAAEERLIEHFVSDFNSRMPHEIAETLAKLDRKTSSLRAGTVENEQYDYDPYGSGYSYTIYDDYHISVSYFPPEAVSKMIQIVKRLEDGKRQIAMRLLSEQNADLALLIQLGLDNHDWRKDIFEPILRTVKEINLGRFSPGTDETIIRQLT